MPTPSKPLTPSFPCPGPQTSLPPGHHPATPRFLLSLLATAVYLSIPSTASQALNAILSSIGPHTVIQYLNFAIGKPIGNPHENEPVVAVGLESLAEKIQDDVTSESSTSIHTTKREQDSPELLETEQMSQKLDDLDIRKEDPSESSSDSFEMVHEYRNDGAFSHYGAVSDKIGEATACWLARWGPDILPYERSAGDAFTPVDSPGVVHPSQVEETSSIPAVWARGGLNHKWVRALISSDALFVNGERERYDLAKNVVDLRRRSGIDEEEEKEWSRMFSTAIYYPHMVHFTFDIIIFTISNICLISHWTTLSHSHETYHRSLASYMSHYLYYKQHTGASHCYATS